MQEDLYDFPPIDFDAWLVAFAQAAACNPSHPKIQLYMKSEMKKLAQPSSPEGSKPHIEMTNNMKPPQPERSTT
jgi:hypothetical protein